MNKIVAQTLAKKENGEKGFTLIELLVVVIIIGILAAIAIPVFLNMRQGAWRSSVESDVKNAVLAIETITSKNNGTVPNTIVTTGLPEGPNYLTAAGAAGATAANAAATITVSPDNIVTITRVDEHTYTVTGVNKNLTGASNGYAYSSATGAGDWTAAGYTAP